MEVLEVIKELVNSLGFPIAMCVYFIWDKSRSQEQTNKILVQMNETLVVIKEYIEREEKNG